MSERYDAVRELLCFLNGFSLLKRGKLNMAKHWFGLLAKSTSTNVLLTRGLDEHRAAYDAKKFLVVLEESLNVVK